MIKFILPLLLGAVLQAKVIAGVSVIVEEHIITTYDIAQEMKLAHVNEKQAQEILIRKKLEAIEIKKRALHVNEDEVYDEIRKLAQNNHMSLSQFYDAVRESNNLTSSQFKQKIKERLLSQKLYQAIAMSKLNQPDEKEIQEYYNLHKKELSKPAFVDATIYSAQQKALLEKKIQNPMFYSQTITQTQQRIDLQRVNPQLASLLLHTKEKHFTPVIPDGKGGFICFYVTNVAKSQESSLESIRYEVINAIMQSKREAILNDYFAKLQDSAEIVFTKHTN